jgi:hypothetical protein
MSDQPVVPEDSPNPSQGSGESQNAETVDSLKKRLRDMQSMKDRAEAQLRQIAPLIEQMQSRPPVQAGPQVVPSQGDDPLAIPQRPEPPDGYDEHAAFNEPGSESWKYRKARDKYLEQMADWNVNQAKRAQVEAQRRLERQREAVAVQQVKGDLRAWAIADKGTDEATAIRFVETISRDETFQDRDILWVVFQAIENYRNGGRVPDQARTPADFGPPPTGGGSPQRSVSEDETKSFNEGLLAHRKRLRVGR